MFVLFCFFGSSTCTYFFLSTFATFAGKVCGEERLHGNVAENKGGALSPVHIVSPRFVHRSPLI